MSTASTPGLCLWLPLALVPQAAQAPSAAAQARAPQAALERFLAASDAAAGASALEALEAAGASAAPFLASALAQTYSAFAAPDPTLREAQRQVLVRALARMGPDVVAATCAAALDCPDVERRSAGLRLAGSAMGNEGFDVLLYFAERAARESGGGLLGAVFTEELARTLEREPKRFAQLAARMGTLEQAWSERVLVAGRNSQRPEFIDLLVDLLGGGGPPRRPMCEAARAVGRFPLSRGVRLIERSRAHLSSADPFTCQAAAQVLGRLHDAASAEALIELLDHAHAGVRASAYWALTEIAQLRLPPTAARWRAWWRGEQAWLAAQHARLELELQAAEPARALAALRELGLHGTQLDAFAASLASCLEHPSPAVRGAALAQVERARLTGLLPQVERLGEDPDEVLAARARALDRCWRAEP